MPLQVQVVFYRFIALKKKVYIPRLSYLTFEVCCWCWFFVFCCLLRFWLI